MKIIFQLSINFIVGLNNYAASYLKEISKYSASLIEIRKSLDEQMYKLAITNSCLHEIDYILNVPLEQENIMKDLLKKSLLDDGFKVIISFNKFTISWK